MIWGDSRPRNVAGTIESYVSLLRSRLGDASGLIATETGGYRADPEMARVDLDRFDALLREAAGAPPVERRQRLEAALALATRDVLEDDDPDAAARLDAAFSRPQRSRTDHKGMDLAFAWFPTEQ